MRRVTWGATIAVLLMLAAVGCNDDGDDINIVEEFTTDNFPGNQIQDTNVADDERAFSINGQDFLIGSLKCHPNGGTGAGIVTFGTQDGGEFHLWASAYAAGRFTTPVELLGDDIDITDAPQFQGVVVGFFNTQTFNESNDNVTNQNIRNRFGDAVILWTRRDFTVVSDGNVGVQDGDDVAGQNDRLYYSYFNADLVLDQFAVANLRGVNEIFQNGFSEQADILDVLDEGIDVRNVRGGENGTDASAEDVISMGIISDGLCGCAEFSGDTNGLLGANLTNSGDQGADYTWGDNVTHMVAVWTQIDDADSGAIGVDEGDDGTDNPADQRGFFAILDLETAIFGAATDDGAFLAGADGAEGDTDGGARGLGTVAIVGVDETLVELQGFLVESSTLINRYSDVEDEVGVGVEDFALNAASVVLVQENAQDLDDHNAEVGEGHSALDTNLEGTSNAGNAGNNADFANDALTIEECFGVDNGLDAAFVYFVSRVDTAGIADVNDSDLFANRFPADLNDFVQNLDQAQLSDDNTDAAGGANVIEDTVLVEVNRTGDYMGVLFQQPATDVEDNGNNVALRGNVVFDGLNDLVRGVAGGQVTDPELISTMDDVDNDNVLDVAFQNDLGFICGIQSDADRMGFIFAQEEDEGGLDDNEELHASGLDVFGLDADGAPFAAANDVIIDAAFIDGEFEIDGLGGFGEGRAGAQAIDGGFDGLLFVVHTRDTDIDDIGSGNLLFASEVDVFDGGGVQEQDVMSSANGLDGTREALGLLDLDATPTPRVIGNGNAAAQDIHILSVEERGDEPLGGGFGTAALVHRAYNARDINDLVLFENQFNPNLDENQFEIDTHEHDNVFFANFTGTLNNTYGVFFEQDGHIFYNEFTNNNWIIENGDIEPQLFDNASAQNPEFEDICTEACTCDNLGGVLGWFSDEGGSQTPDDDRRLYVRVRNGSGTNGDASNGQSNGG